MQHVFAHHTNDDTTRYKHANGETLLIADYNRDTREYTVTCNHARGTFATGVTTGNEGTLHFLACAVACEIGLPA